MDAKRTGGKDRFAFLFHKTAPFRISSTVYHIFKGLSTDKKRNIEAERTANQLDRQIAFCAEVAAFDAVNRLKINRKPGEAGTKGAKRERVLTAL